ncbi:MAG: hypothetical protein AAF411_28230 [Myxococcota bacterium]
MLTLTFATTFFDDSRAYCWLKQFAELPRWNVELAEADGLGEEFFAPGRAAYLWTPDALYAARDGVWTALPAVGVAPGTMTFSATVLVERRMTTADLPELLRRLGRYRSISFSTAARQVPSSLARDHPSARLHHGTLRGRSLLVNPKYDPLTRPNEAECFPSPLPPQPVPIRTWLAISAECVAVSDAYEASWKEAPLMTPSMGNANSLGFALLGALFLLLAGGLRAFLGVLRHPAEPSSWLRAETTRSWGARFSYRTAPERTVEPSTLLRATVLLVIRVVRPLPWLALFAVLALFMTVALLWLIPG